VVETECKSKFTLIPENEPKNMSAILSRPKDRKKNMSEWKRSKEILDKIKIALIITKSVGSMRGLARVCRCSKSDKKHKRLDQVFGLLNGLITELFFCRVIKILQKGFPFGADLWVSGSNVPVCRLHEKVPYIGQLYISL
jgi:hypothetical protein